jgi:hypothetical protein
MRVALLSLFAVVLLPGAAPAFPRALPRPKDTLDEQVRGAIQRGVKYLREQERDGKWEAKDAAIPYPDGFTSLAVLALLTAGVPPDDAVIQRGLKHLRTVRPEQTYVVALQTMAFARAGEAQDRVRIQRNADWLLAARLRDGWTYSKPAVRNLSAADNSNTQYALLGLEAARRAGAKVDRKALEGLRKFYLDTQADGGWSYRPRERPTLSMTAAGLCGLVLTGRELDAGLHKLRADGSAADCGHYPDGRASEKALEWVGGHFPRRLTEESATRSLGAPFYTLAAVGRAGRLTGRRYFGEADWYEVGARHLMATQKEDGSWTRATGPGSRFPDYWPVVATSFAVLFLAEGRTPVLVAKLAYGPPDGRGWDNQRDAVRHLVEFTGRELFKKRPLAWQVFDVRRRDVTDAEVKALAAALREAPVVFFNGHTAAPRGKEEAILKEYLARGGLVFAEACCGQPAFDRDFRALMKRLFPDDPLRPLPADHPLWKAGKFAVGPKDCPLEGVTRGGRTVVIYSPKPLAGYWEADDQRGRGAAAFRVGASVLAYATRGVPPLPRGHSAKVER